MSCQEQFRQVLLNQLESLLTEVSGYLQTVRPPNARSNACASCFTCCTARGLTSHRVTDMEYDLIAERRGRQVALNFRAYIEKQTDFHGELLHPRCPNYSEELQGCGIYQHRPYACRIFGHMRPAGTGFPEGCHFGGHEVVFPAEQYYQRVPGAKALRSLVREYDLLRPAQAAHYVDASQAPASEAAEIDMLSPDDPVDQSMLLQSQGRDQEALEILLQARGEGNSLHLDYCLASLLTRLGEHEAALAVYRHLLQYLPQRHDLRYYAGFHALFGGQREEARRHFEETVHFLPQHSLALGFLGYLALQDEDWQRAAELLSRAVQADPSNPYFVKRLAAVEEKLLRRRSLAPDQVVEAC